jgi:hypothetical protein
MGRAMDGAVDRVKERAGAMHSLHRLVEAVVVEAVVVAAVVVAAVVVEVGPHHSPRSAVAVAAVAVCSVAGVVLTLCPGLPP